MTQPVVQFTEVCKSYGTHPVLTDLSFAVSPGEKLALIGASGSGKTTILRILMTLETVQSGAVLVGGHPLWSAETMTLPPRRREAHLEDMRSNIGMVFQQFNLFPHMSVLKNITLAPVLRRGLTERAARDLAMDLLEMVGMANKAQCLARRTVRRPEAASGNCASAGLEAQGHAV